jgi:hypothetical protein
MATTTITDTLANVPHPVWPMAPAIASGPGPAVTVFLLPPTLNA